MSYFVVEMEGGFSNKTIVYFFSESTNDDIKKTSLVFFLLTSQIDLSISII